MKTHQVAGGGGVQLHVVEAGNPGGRPILFIHGGSQSWLTWSRQLDSELARVSSRRNGSARSWLSDKPRDAYGDSRLWADDVAAIIDALNDRPVLSGWSAAACHPGLSTALRRGPYRRHPLRRRHYETGSDAAMSVITPEWLSLVPGLCATDAEESVEESRVIVAIVLPSAAVRPATCT